MDQRQLYAININHLLEDQVNDKLISKKNLLPIAKNISILEDNTKITIKFRNKDGEITISDEVHLRNYKDIYSLSLRNDILDQIKTQLVVSTFLFVLNEGTKDSSRIILYFDKANIFELLQKENPSLRLSTYALPPTKITKIDSVNTQSVIYKYLSSECE